MSECVRERVQKDAINISPNYWKSSCCYNHCNVHNKLFSLFAFMINIPEWNLFVLFSCYFRVWIQCSALAQFGSDVVSVVGFYSISTEPPFACCSWLMVVSLLLSTFVFNFRCAAFYFIFTVLCSLISSCTGMHIAYGNTPTISYLIYSLRLRLCVCVCHL